MNPVLNSNGTLLRSNRGGTVSGETSTRFMARRNWAPKISLLFLFQIPQNRLRRALQRYVSAAPPTGKTYRNAQKGAQSMATSGNSWWKCANVNQDTFPETPAPLIKTAISPRVNKSEVCVFNRAQIFD